MSSIDLAKDMSGVYEKDGVLACAGASLGLVEEPKRDGQGDRVEEVSANRDHHIDGTCFD